ncbi:MAG: helix-turn-helix transcriptional regulator [Verrucomicrobiae bacterium]|nr:helix-turn-helix transcriptional regulator [Verrucomicrobiae bacterium]NNJ86584.1 hypothetical protein [Akkermansiaceae bacterium]
MKVKPPILASIRSGLESKGLKKIDLTRHLGRPTNWTTKLFNGTIKNLDDEEADKIAAFLGVSFGKITLQGRVPEVAVRLGEMMNEDSEVTALLTALAEVLERR